MKKNETRGWDMTDSIIAVAIVVAFIALLIGCFFSQELVEGGAQPFLILLGMVLALTGVRGMARHEFAFSLSCPGHARDFTLKGSIARVTCVLLLIAGVALAGWSGKWWWEFLK